MRCGLCRTDDVEVDRDHEAAPCAASSLAYPDATVRWCRFFLAVQNKEKTDATAAAPSPPASAGVGEANSILRFRTFMQRLDVTVHVTVAAICGAEEERRQKSEML